MAVAPEVFSLVYGQLIFLLIWKSLESFVFDYLPAKVPRSALAFVAHRQSFAKISKFRFIRKKLASVRVNCATRRSNV